MAGVDLKAAAFFTLDKTVDASGTAWISQAPTGSATMILRRVIAYHGAAQTGPSILRIRWAHKDTSVAKPFFATLMVPTNGSTQMDFGDYAGPVDHALQAVEVGGVACDVGSIYREDWA